MSTKQAHKYLSIYKSANATSPAPPSVASSETGSIEELNCDDEFDVALLMFDCNREDSFLALKELSASLPSSMPRAFIASRANISSCQLWAESLIASNPDPISAIARANTTLDITTATPQHKATEIELCSASSNQDRVVRLAKSYLASAALPELILLPDMDSSALSQVADSLSVVSNPSTLASSTEANSSKTNTALILTLSNNKSLNAAQISSSSTDVNQEEVFFQDAAAEFDFHVMNGVDYACEVILEIASLPEMGIPLHQVYFRPFILFQNHVTTKTFSLQKILAPLG